LNKNGRDADTWSVPYRPETSYRPESQYFVTLDAPPEGSGYTPPARERDWNDARRSDPEPKRRRRPMTIRPVGLLLLALAVWVGWAYTTPGGPSARVNDWIDQTRGNVAAVSAGPGLHRTAAYFNQLYATEGSYPNMSDTAIQEDPNAAFGLGMTFTWCSGQAVVLGAPTAAGSASRLLLSGQDLGEVDGAPGCPANLAKPSPWKLPDGSG
jgi:hypothetical protein